jgi:hypothetical protein
MIADIHLFNLVQEWAKELQVDRKHQDQQHPLSKLLLADLILKQSLGELNDYDS